MKKKFIMQDGSKDCGVTCLYNIIKYYGGNINIYKLRNMLNTSKNGTSIYDIVKTSNTLGLIANAYRCELNDLCSINYPSIAHIKIDGKYDHFIIIQNIIDDEILIFDPIRGYLKYDLEDFEKEWTNNIITFEKTDNLIKEKTYYFITSYIKKNIFMIFLIVFLSIFTTLLSILNSFYLSYLYDNPFISYKIFMLFIILIILRVLIEYVRNNYILNYTNKFDYTITNNIYNKVLTLPIEYHHTRPVGDVISRINDTSSIKQFINTISFSLILDVITIFLISIILFKINKIIFLILFIMSIIYSLTYFLHRKALKNNSILVKENASISNTLLIESIIGMDTIKNTNIEDKFKDLFKNKYDKFLNSNLNLNKTIINYNVLQDFIQNITSIIIIFVGIILYNNKILSLENVITLNLLIINFHKSFKNIISLDELIIESKNSYKRIIDLYKEKNESFLEFKNINIKKIEFKNLNYSYNSYNVLNNINFTINKNDFVFIKGKSGQGKSTIFKLLLKQLKCDNNMIKINNKDINLISRKSMIDNICLVSQNEYIFTDSVLNNIMLYKEPNDKELQKVLKVSKVDEILEKRNIDLNFLLEENGHNISGGERQRILLARSLIQNKSVLILDETLNELDITTEREILKNIKDNYNITLILISHRDNNSDLFNKIIEVGGKNERINN